MEVRKLGESLRSDLAELVPRSVLDMRGGAETSRCELKEERKEEE